MDNDTIEEILSQLPVGDRRKVKNMLKLEEDKDLPILEELQDINETLKKIADKPDITIPPFPEIPEPKEFPKVQKVEITNLPKEKEIKPTDLTKTNALLQKILDKEDKDIEITATLEII